MAGEEAVEKAAVVGKEEIGNEYSDAAVDSVGAVQHA